LECRGSAPAPQLSRMRPSASRPRRESAAIGRSPVGSGIGRSREGERRLFARFAASPLGSGCGTLTSPATSLGRPMADDRGIEPRRPFLTGFGLASRPIATLAIILGGSCRNRTHSTVYKPSTRFSGPGPYQSARLPFAWCPAQDSNPDKRFLRPS
jgi:hypothetical protein